MAIAVNLRRHAGGKNAFTLCIVRDENRDCPGRCRLTGAGADSFAEGVAARWRLRLGSFAPERAATPQRLHACRSPPDAVFARTELLFAMRRAARRKAAVCFGALSARAGESLAVLSPARAVPTSPAPSRRYRIVAPRSQSRHPAPATQAAMVVFTVDQTTVLTMHFLISCVLSQPSPFHPAQGFKNPLGALPRRPLATQLMPCYGCELRNFLATFPISLSNTIRAACHGKTLRIGEYSRHLSLLCPIGGVTPIQQSGSGGTRIGRTRRGPSAPPPAAPIRTSEIH